LSDISGKLAGLLDHLFSKVFKKGLDIPGIEQLHQSCAKIAALITTSADRAALERCKRLNDAVKAGFEKIEADIVKIEASVKKLEKSKEALPPKPSSDGEL